MTIKITEKLLGKARTLGADKHWATNGHWIIRLDQVSNAIVFRDLEIAQYVFGLTHLPLSQVRPSETGVIKSPPSRDDAHRLRDTCWVKYVGKYGARIFESKSHRTAIDPYYAHCLRADDGWPAYQEGPEKPIYLYESLDEDARLVAVVMPMRV